MIKKLTLITCFFLSLISVKAQSSENSIFEITSRVKIYLPETDNAVLEGNERFIQIGLLGNKSDKDELVGHMDRFVVKDKDMIIRVGGGVSEEFIDYYKFYLDPLYDANDFQKMLEMLQVKTYFIVRTEYPVSTFSNTILAYIKKKS